MGARTGVLPAAHVGADVIGLLALGRGELEREVPEELRQDRPHLHLGVVQNGIYGAEISGWEQQLVSRIGVPDHTWAKFLPMQSLGVCVKGENRRECGLRAA